jgi:Protein of unknown function (DUF2934)
MLIPFDREKRIAEAAYYRAEKRGFAPGYALEDWLAAEALVDFELAAADSRIAAANQDV